ncbi:proline dehydrogenase [Croceibacterium salegens]|uniref:proline dehydrogenase n=1 Tax=Croceibacterium salegens TaxID=1737568 RepID=UPI002E25DCC7
MSSALRARLRDVRYALPELVEKVSPGLDVTAAVAHFASLGGRGIRTSAGYFHASGETVGEVAAIWGDLAAGLAAAGIDTRIAVKANAIGFDRAAVAGLVASGIPLTFDAMAPVHADAILSLGREFAAGVALPARWQRSAADAVALRDTPCRIRLVKGEWADPVADVPDVAAAYLSLVERLAGRTAPVGIATHDPALAEAALTMLVASSTPCELEQLRGLPRRRTTAIAKRLGVPVRLYLPFGPGWWPYAVNQALARPHLPLWAMRDALGL